MRPRATPDVREHDPLSDPSLTETRIRRSLFGGALLIAIAIVATFVYAEWRTERILADQLVGQARAFTKQIVATRQYVAGHGGVWVRASEEVVPNPYLAAIPGLKTRVVDTSGTAYILQNPALVVREVGEEMRRLSGPEAEFRLASDRPVNPANQADAAEAAALRAFAEGADEYHIFEDRDEEHVLRYVYPLSVEEECLLCHERQGWRVGQTRGAVSVILPAATLADAKAEGRLLTGVALVSSLATLLGALYLIATRLLVGLLTAEESLRELAVVDALTGLMNRRAAMKRLSDEVRRSDRDGQGFAILMMDLDHFKRVNDTAGHAVGDAVLVAAAEAMARSARAYDSVARIGGEEFLLLMPAASTEQACAAAERVRAAVAEATSQVPGWGASVTLSVGVAVHAAGEDDRRGDVLRRADRALYEAKEAGRDRTVAG